MKFQNVILEGPDVVQHNAKGERIMQGWRHYRFIIAGRFASTIGRPFTPEIAAEKYQAVLFDRGTWEDETRQVLPGRWPVPRLSVLDMIQIPVEHFERQDGPELTLRKYA